MEDGRLFEKTIQITFNMITGLIPFNDIINLVSALRLESIKLDYNILHIDQLNQVDFLITHK